MAYLYGWLNELVGMSGSNGMAGLNALTPTTVRDWSELTGNVVRPVEFWALRKLDAVMRNPGTDDEDKAKESRG